MTSEELYKIASGIDRNWRENQRMVGQDLPLELRACETVALVHGFDNQSGDVASPSGYFYRVSRWIVKIDNDGFKYLSTFETEDEASKAFGVLDDIFAEWERGE